MAASHSFPIQINHPLLLVGDTATAKTASIQNYLKNLNADQNVRYCFILHFYFVNFFCCCCLLTIFSLICISVDFTLYKCFTCFITTNMHIVLAIIQKCMRLSRAWWRCSALSSHLVIFFSSLVSLSHTSNEYTYILLF